MKILVVGGGGREHALAWALGRGPGLREILCAPGNPGIAKVARCISVEHTDVSGLVRLAQDESTDLVVVGPEASLEAGLVDALSAAGVRAFGPTKAATAIESSKAFAKTLLRKYSIPTADFRVFDSQDAALVYVREAPMPLVVKADGLAGGKGVCVASNRQEAITAVRDMMVLRQLGPAGDRVVVEERLHGEEVSILAITDGTTIAMLPEAQDYKRVFDGGRGPQTGGMGAYSPTPYLDDTMAHTVARTIMVPAIHGMKRDGRPFRGLLYAGLMMTRVGPKVLEFNARFGDPEAQAILPRIQSDLAEILMAAVEGHLDQVKIDVDQRPAVSVVLASTGYPDRPRTGDEITGIEDAEAIPDVLVFQSGTARIGGRLVTSGGRVMTVTALGKDLTEARELAYRAADLIRFEGKQARTDIART